MEQQIKDLIKKYSHTIKYVGIADKDEKTKTVTVDVTLLLEKVWNKAQQELLNDFYDNGCPDPIPRWALTWLEKQESKK